MRALTLLALLPLASGCSSERSDEPSAGGAAQRASPRPQRTDPARQEPVRDPEPIDPATAGRVRGVVHFDGEPPRRRAIGIGSDAACAAMHEEAPRDERVIVADGRLANAFVRVRRGLEGWIPPAAEAEEVELDQRGCLYRPHVLGMVAGQRLVVRNSDPTTHNVNVRAPRNGASKNVTQAAGGPPLVLELARRETGIDVSCDIHPWMGAVVHVEEHPFFAVSGADGTFEIAGLPPGSYELEAVHETLGKRTASVEVPESGTGEVELRFGR